MQMEQSRVGKLILLGKTKGEKIRMVIELEREKVRGELKKEDIFYG